MKKLRESTVEMLRSKRAEFDYEMTVLEDEIVGLGDQIKTLQSILDYKISKYNEYNEMCKDICELIGYEES